MNKFIITGYLLVLLSGNIFVFGQNNEGLSLSDNVPDIMLTHFLNEPGKKMQLSELRGKLVILDFWNVNCGTCITSMPEMDSLQQQFKNKIQIILITKNSAEQVRQLFAKVKIKQPGLPMIVSDTILNNLFPHNGDPLHVWINSKGLVAAITQYYNTNYETISEELTNGHIQLPRRRDSGIDIYYPLLSEQNKTILPLTTFHSMLLKGTQDYLTGSSIQIKKDPDTQKSYSIEAINVRLFTLYKIAYFPALYGFNASVYSIQNNNRLILLVKDSLPFYQPTDPGKTGKWIKDNMYAYETTIPENAGLNIFETMQEDLSRYFKYTVKIEKRKTKCMVLVRTSSEDKLMTKDSNARPSIISLGKKGLRIQNMPLKESLLKMIVYANDRLPEPILDETGYKSNIDITLNVSLRDIPSLRKSLKIFGLDLIEKETETDFLVIQDRKTN